LSRAFRVKAGSTLIVDWGDATSDIAIKGHTVGVTGYIGDFPHTWSGILGRVITNANFSLLTPEVGCIIQRVLLPLTVKGN
jgi:hypothetical protein